MPETKRTVTVLTALSLEYDAMREHLTDIETLTHPRYGTKAKRGQLPGTPWQVVLVNMGEGTLTAATLTERVLTWLDPEAVLLVGVAGGLKDDIGIGDVVIATKVYSIHGGKQTPEGFLVRPEAWKASHRLEQAAKEALGGGRAADFRTDFRTHFKPIAVGDVVLTDQKSALARHIHTHYNDAVAIEMESTGVANAVHLAGEAGALIIRGISDKADPDKSEADKGGSQPRAAGNAAAAAVAVLRELVPKQTTDPQEGPFRGERYGGDHFDFRDSTFNGSFVAKFVGHRPGDEDGR
ncbi:5'-methylthioadenosine/S-adenosylhomocysteine nucleosidase family protein [Streptomyces geranii]|uniref:5'-methylthioadenosine/S-adenosylhomocysteine nucleosidase family protein n=1 Tax=Streptomyces geranii TaxID=2058923 RepID=UPI000D037AC9|nr:5'-methylthioadenosine/S-adenosylhomocysteine nucleosidase [Streptomyces geranii]